MSGSTHRRAPRWQARFQDDPYEAILHARRVVGRFGSPAVQRRMKEAQAILYKIETIAGHEREVRGVASLLHGSGIELMRTAGYLNQVAGRTEEPSRTGE